MEVQSNAEPPALPAGQTPVATPAHGTPPPHGPQLRIILTILVVAVLAMFAGMKWHGAIGRVSDKVLALSSPPAKVSGTLEWYTCAMDPFVITHKPGLCPVCHMDLVKLDPNSFSTEVSLSPMMTQNIGVRIAPVTTGPVASVIRTVGSVDYDETRVRDVNLKIAGWVQKLHVDYTGQSVKKGQPLLEIYSPDLYTAQAEYLSVFKTVRGTTTASAPSELNQWDRDLLDAARKRLENFDISPGQIRELEKSGTASKTMTLYSPFDGLVIAKNVSEGQKVDPGMALYRIADLSKVWVQITLYEYQLPQVQLGQAATITLPYFPNVPFKGNVAYIYPYINPENRQVRVRLELDNAKGQLKPGMFADVELQTKLADARILVPADAIIDTGTSKRVMISLGQGRFKPRDVETDFEADNGMVVIKNGLTPGEMVVVSGQFLLDSEASRHEALAKMIKGEMASEQPATEPTSMK